MLSHAKEFCRQSKSRRLRTGLTAPVVSGDQPLLSKELFHFPSNDEVAFGGKMHAIVQDVGLWALISRQFAQEVIEIK